MNAWNTFSPVLIAAKRSRWCWTPRPRNKPTSKIARCVAGRSRSDTRWRMIPSSSLRPGVQREANFTIAPATAAGRVSGIQCWAPGMTSRLAFGSAWCKRAACSKGKCLSCSAHIPRTRRWKVTLYGRRLMGTTLYLRDSDFPRAYPSPFA